MKLFLDPHGDDGALFGSYIIQREDPAVMFMYDSYIQPQRGCAGCGVKERQNEALDALRKLTVTGYYRDHFCGLHDDLEYSVEGVSAIIKANCGIRGWNDIDEVWAPALELHGHAQHNLISLAANACFPNLQIKHYLTYTRTGGRSRSSNPIPCTPEMIARKHRALACFPSQMQEETGCKAWFMGDLYEYYSK